MGWYLWTHELIEVSGKDAAVFLDRMFPKNIGNLAIGRERYTTMLDENASIIDDVVIFRMDEQKFWVSTLFTNTTIPWFDAHKENLDVSWDNITSKWEMYAVQGPKSLEMVNTLVKVPVDDQKFFQIRENEIDGVPVYINRAGYTGEKLGYEIYIAPRESMALEAKLRNLAPQFGGKEVTEFQVLAWTLPTEAGFYYMRDLRHTNPYEVGLASGINFEKEFVGREALIKIRDEGAKREVLFFTVEDADIYIRSRHLGCEGEKVFVNGEEEEIGRVMKLVYSYVKEINYGTLIVKKGFLKPGDTIMLHGHEAKIIEGSIV